MTKNVNFELISDLEEILIRLELVTDTMQALSDACCESQFALPKKSLVIPSCELREVQKDYKKIVETLNNKNVVNYNG